MTRAMARIVLLRFNASVRGKVGRPARQITAVVQSGSGSEARHTERSRAGGRPPASESLATGMAGGRRTRGKRPCAQNEPLASASLATGMAGGRRADGGRPPPRRLQARRGEVDEGVGEEDDQEGHGGEQHPQHHVQIGVPRRRRDLGGVGGCIYIYIYIYIAGSPDRGTAPAARPAPSVTAMSANRSQFVSPFESKTAARPAPSVPGTPPPAPAAAGPAHRIGLGPLLPADLRSRRSRLSQFIACGFRKRTRIYSPPHRLGPHTACRRCKSACRISPALQRRRHPPPASEDRLPSLSGPAV